MNSLETAKTYCKTFGAEVTLKNSNGIAYEYCVLSVNDEDILALAEAKNPYDVEVHKMRWETMIFNGFELGTVDAVKNAFDVLREGGVVIEEIYEYPWSKCGVTGRVWCGTVRAVPMGVWDTALDCRWLCNQTIYGKEPIGNVIWRGMRNNMPLFC